MNTKLTLTIEDSLIKQAKEYAKDKGRSLSDIIENYLKIITKDSEISIEKNTPITNSLKGSFKIPKDFDYKKSMSDRLTEKHL